MRLFFILALTFRLIGAEAQVENNNIENRVALTLDAGWTRSSTNEADVEWDCVNKALTNKCLVYHNDQWFTFTVQQDGTYFLNVAAQECSKNLGVQAIIIEGNPCEIKTYRILQCIPKISREDIYIQLDSLKKDVQYLVNIDGFLGDFCEFNIQLGSQPFGFSLQQVSLDTLNLTASASGRSILLKWTGDESILKELEHFEISRKNETETKFNFLKTVPVELNALGSLMNSYQTTDSLETPGTYVYRISGVFKTRSDKLILDQQTVRISPTYKSVQQPYANFPLDYKKGTKLQVLLLDTRTDMVLRETSFEFDKRFDSNQRVFLGKYIKAGFTDFTIRIRDIKKNSETEFRYLVNEQGEVIPAKF